MLSRFNPWRQRSAAPTAEPGPDRPPVEYFLPDDGVSRPQVSVQDWDKWRALGKGQASPETMKAPPLSTAPPKGSVTPEELDLPVHSWETLNFLTPEETLNPSRLPGTKPPAGTLPLGAQPPTVEPSELPIPNVGAPDSVAQRLANAPALASLPARLAKQLADISDALKQGDSLPTPEPPAKSAEADISSVDSSASLVGDLLDGRGDSLTGLGTLTPRADETSAPTFRPVVGDGAVGDHAVPGAVTDFLIRTFIGRGGQGEVWSATQTALHREIAVKIHQRGDVGEFLQEAYTAGELEHPNIVPVYDLSRIAHNGHERPMLAMKFIRGTPWNKILSQGRRRSDPGTQDAFLNEQLTTLMTLCNAVAFAHSKRILHRDLKPHQVVIGDFGEVYLSDWGLAVYLGEEAPRAGDSPLPKFRCRDSATNPAGTPAYMAPEQTLRSTEKLSAATDVYLLGAILFEIVTGHPPHGSDSALRSYDMARRNDIGPLPDWCPAELREIVMRSLATDPAHRFQSVVEFRQALVEFVSGAGRKRDSEALADEVAREFERPESAKHLGYMQLIRLEQQVNRALQLWPENPRAKALSTTILARLADTALAKSDLELAKTLATMLPAHHPERGTLLAASDEQGRARRRMHLQRTMWFALSVVLSAALGYSIMSNMLVQKGRALREAEARSLASERRAVTAEEKRIEAERELARREQMLLSSMKEGSYKMELANKLFYAGDHAGAAKLFQEISSVAGEALSTVTEETRETVSATLRMQQRNAKYNEACAYSLKGRLDDSLVALYEAVDFGFTDVPHIKADSDLKNVRNGRPEEFAAILQRAAELDLENVTPTPGIRVQSEPGSIPWGGVSDALKRAFIFQVDLGDGTRVYHYDSTAEQVLTPLPPMPPEPAEEPEPLDDASMDDEDTPEPDPDEEESTP